jgi:phosphohistidine phosphatase
MDLILWRHAEAANTVPDMSRALTAKGRKQAEQMARWLHKHLPEHTRVLVSPATRAQQTAQALTSHVELEPAIGPGASFSTLLSKAGWPEAAGAVLVVGHQPTLGQAAAMLISGVPEEWTIRKGAVFWLSRRTRDEHAQVVLRAAMSPDLL